jgi:hypothetical protein
MGPEGRPAPILRKPIYEKLDDQKMSFNPN